MADLGAPIMSEALDKIILSSVKDVSPELATYLNGENLRQQRNVELIASENFVSDAVRLAMASTAINKYAEGYPEHRYYGGCDMVDRIEILCQKEWQGVFHTDYHVNVQPHSGTQANFAAYASVCATGDDILALSMDCGGHLSHSSPVGFVNDLYCVHSYGLTEDGLIDYNMVRKMADMFRPKLIVAGASAYSREIDYEAFASIAKDVDAYLMADIAHVAGLIATGLHQSPFGVADIITTTTQKTLRGPRGGLIFCKPELAKAVDKAVFPYSQGGPHMNTIAAKAVCACEAQLPSYIIYMRNVVENAKAMANEFISIGYDVVTGGTDNHMFLLDLRKKYPELTGAEAQKLLEQHDITVNKNMVPNDERSPFKASGLRIGTPAMTTMGWQAQNFVECAHEIDSILAKKA